MGRGRGGKTGLYIHVAKLPTEFIEGRGSGPSDDGKKEALDERGVSLSPSLSSMLRGCIGATAFENSTALSSHNSQPFLSFFSVFPRGRPVRLSPTHLQLLSNHALP